MEILSANAITLAAGLAAINVLEHSPVYEHIDKLGSIAREEMNRIFTRCKFSSTGSRHRFNVLHSHDKQKANQRYQRLRHYDHAQYKKMFNFLLENGIVILLPEIMHGGISYAHTEKDIKHLTSTLREYVNPES